MNATYPRGHRPGCPCPPCSHVRRRVEGPVLLRRAHARVAARPRPGELVEDLRRAARRLLVLDLVQELEVEFVGQGQGQGGPV